MVRRMRRPGRSNSAPRAGGRRPGLSCVAGLASLSAPYSALTKTGSVDALSITVTWASNGSNPSVRSIVAVNPSPAVPRKSDSTFVHW